MANLYESNSFNIVSVYQQQTWKDIDEDNKELFYLYILEVQRLPLSQYPELTTVSFFEDQIPSTATKSEFLNLAPPIVSQILQDYDANYDGSSHVAPSVNSLSQKFTD